MSGNRRKLSSKWDLRDDTDFAPDGVASINSSKWSYLKRNDKLKPSMGFSSKEPFPGRRGSNKNDVSNKDYRVLDATVARDTDGSYSSKMSPGFEEWENKKHSQPQNDGCSRPARSSQSRSRTRSPPPGFCRDSGVTDRNKIRAGRSAQPCRDFVAGKCRRGSHCHFLHHDNQNYEDSWESKHRQDGAPTYSAPCESGDHYLTSVRSNDACISFAKGTCRVGVSCKYVHHDNSDELGKISMDESPREREIDRRRIENSIEKGGRHCQNRGGDTPCKFFAFGNCRNGKHCRFSHDRQAFRSHSRRLKDDRSRSDQGGDQASYRPNGRIRGDRWGSDGSMADVDKVWDGPKQSDFVVVSDTAKLVEDSKNGITGAPESEFTAWPMSGGWDHNLDKNRVHGESPFSTDKKEVNRWTPENAIDNIRISPSVDRGIWPGDEKMSPDWNYGHIKEEHGQNKEQAAPGQGFNRNSQNVTSDSSICHAVGQSKVAVSIVPPRVGIVEGMQNQEVSTEKTYIDEPNTRDASLSQFGSRDPPTQNMVSKEQLAQLTCLSTSLPHILGTVRKLPQLYATLNSHYAKDTTSVDKTEGSDKPASTTFIKQDPAIGFQKQCDPMRDSMQPKNYNAKAGAPTFSPGKKLPKDAVEIPSLLSNAGQNFDDSSKSAFSEEQLVKTEDLIKLHQGENIEVNKENNEMVAEEKQSSRCENKITHESGPLANMDQNDEAKKIKDVKGIRAFKFSLVEFVKELMKPSWKEGQITKEDYKAIVKKVTDKVTGTMQQVHIPQTQEKIDHYLSFSKPKLDKLVQVSGGSITDFRHMHEGLKILLPLL